MSELPQPRRIALLPDVLINQIAAGEVIERPASVVKELIENCIDANATRIEIDILGGGTESILIRDNGSGIHPDDMQLAILRHTTSKLRTLDDLVNVLSMGFRGEALSSIASVSDFSITSRIIDAEHGWRFCLDPVSGRPILEPAAHPVGTTVEVKNLFYSVPARRKFLRAERTEFLNILDIVKRLVMSRFDIDIRLHHNDKLILDCPAVESDYRVRIKPVMGNRFYTNAHRIDARIDEMRLWGWLGGNESVRNQSDRQYLYLNHRVIRDRQLNHAIRLALEDLIHPSKYPSYILHLELDPAAVDINVHPAKHEVRFKQARNVHDFVYAVLREALSDVQTGRAEVDIHTDYHQMEQIYSGATRETNRLKEQRLDYVVPVSNIDVGQDSQLDPLGIPISVIAERYVIAIYAEEIRLIDLLSLKYNYIYSRLQQDIACLAVKLRPLLVPVMLKVTASELDTLISCKSLLASIGLQVEQSGPDSFMVRSFPALLPDIQIQSVLKEIIKYLCSSSAAIDAERQQAMLKILAYHPGNYNLSGVSISGIREDLRQIANSGLPVDCKHYQGHWRNLDALEIQALLDNEK